MSAQANPNNPRSIFYWNDWENEPSLSLCSLAAQGFWMRLLCIAAKCVPFGYLSVNGRALRIDDFSKMTGHPSAELEMLLNELESNGVFSRDNKGRIYSRRMVADVKKSAINQKNGKEGGNPTLTNKRINSRSVKPPLKPPLNPNTLSESLYTPKPPKGGLREKSDQKENGKVPWAKRVERFFEIGLWLSDWGPPPGEPGCLAPTDIVEAKGKSA